MAASDNAALKPAATASAATISASRRSSYAPNSPSNKLTAKLGPSPLARDRHRRAARLCRRTRSSLPQTQGRPFFLTVRGCAVRRGEADSVFRAITGLMGLQTDTVHPHIHDLRH
jgi:hypothetical protein